jgi:hypothetical protein
MSSKPQGTLVIERQHFDAHVRRVDGVAPLYWGGKCTLALGTVQPHKKVWMVNGDKRHTYPTMVKAAVAVARAARPEVSWSENRWSGA